MSSRTLNLNDELYQYLLSVGVRECEALKALRLETLELPYAKMQISPEQGQLMKLLLQLIGAKRGIEIGVFTGYSTLACAQALPEDGKIIACDIQADNANIGKKYWQQAGVLHKIDLHIAPAIDTLTALLERDQAGSFDYVFIDADKPSQKTYIDLSLQLLRTGGLIMLDNTLWSGNVVDDNFQDEDTQSIRELNAFLCQDPRIDMSMLPIGDGLTLTRKR